MYGIELTSGHSLQPHDWYLWCRRLLGRFRRVQQSYDADWRWHLAIHVENVVWNF